LQHVVHTRPDFRKSRRKSRRDLLGRRSKRISLSIENGVAFVWQLLLHMPMTVVAQRCVGIANRTTRQPRSCDFAAFHVQLATAFTPRPASDFGITQCEMAPRKPAKTKRAKATKKKKSAKRAPVKRAPAKRSMAGSGFGRGRLPGPVFFPARRF